jgi:hypothetical protein
MLHTSIIVELLRSQPRLTFWLAALVQTALWWLVPSIFFSSPPGDLPIVLAVGHEFQLGSYFGPPLAFWLADIAFVIGGTPAVYLLAQACVLLTYWAVFTLGRAIVGIHHATFAVLLMVGISAFTAPTPNFGPSILAMPLVALSLLSLWRAVGERRRVAWFVLALELGLLLLTTYAGLILLAMIAVFMAATRRGRRAMRSLDPLIACTLIVVVLFPHLIWLDQSNGVSTPALRPLQSDDAPIVYVKDWLSLFFWAILVTQLGLIILVALGSKWHLRTTEKVPVFVRSFTDPFARRFVYFFALAPGFTAVTVAVLLGEQQPVGGIAPHLVLSGLAVIVLAGNAIPWHRPRMVGIAWMVLLLAPPLAAASGTLLLPWIGSTVNVSRPANAMGQFFSESFQRRTGAPLAIVSGNPGVAALVALGSPQRPSLYFDANPERSPWVTMADIRRKGAVVLWPDVETQVVVPTEIAVHFPDLVAEVPHAFERTIQGQLPLIRIGWGVLRPQSDAPNSEAKPEPEANPDAGAKPEPEAKQ